MFFNKFKGKSMFDEWLYGNLIKIGNNYFIIKDNEPCDILNIFNQVSEKSIGQFLGIYDKDNNEIYSNDKFELKLENKDPIEYKIYFEDGDIVPKLYNFSFDKTYKPSNFSLPWWKEFKDNITLCKNI